MLGPPAGNFAGSMVDVKKLLASEYRATAKQVVIYWDEGQEGLRSHWMQIMPAGGLHKRADGHTAVAYRIDWV